MSVRLVLFQNQYGVSVAINPAHVVQIVDHQGQGTQTLIRFADPSHDICVPKPLKEVADRLLKDAS